MRKYAHLVCFAVQEAKISDSPSPESADRPSNRCNKRLLLSQCCAGLETAGGNVGGPERGAKDTGSHWRSTTALASQL